MPALQWLVAGTLLAWMDHRAPRRSRACRRWCRKPPTPAHTPCWWPARRSACCPSSALWSAATATAACARRPLNTCWPLWSAGAPRTASASWSRWSAQCWQRRQTRRRRRAPWGARCLARTRMRGRPRRRRRWPAWSATARCRSAWRRRQPTTCRVGARRGCSSWRLHLLHSPVSPLLATVKLAHAPSKLQVVLKHVQPSLLHSRRPA